MSIRDRKGDLPEQTSLVTDVLNWPWPASPRIFRLYDKYVDREVILEAGAEKWILSVGGRKREHRFAPPPARELQQKLVMLTQANRSPATVQKFIASLLLNWQLYLRLLEEGPSHVQDTWDKAVTDHDSANAGKTILKLAVKLSLGPWQARHQGLVKGLDTKANEARMEQHGKIRRRESLVPIAKQTELVKVLDRRASEPNLSERQAEGLAVLAFAFQHGVRPVQQLSLALEHVHTYVDAEGAQVCLVSFHQAKQQNGSAVKGEMLRQVMPEWARPVVLLYGYAREAGRTRLFSASSSQVLWAKARRVCTEVGVALDCTANELRHSSAQALADAGHSRKSIQWFLGHSGPDAANSYLKASRLQGSLINAALGTSKLYGAMVSLAFGEYVTIEELSRVDEDEQIGGIIGDRLIAGIGRCRTKQSACAFDPVVSCYGCHKYIPALNPPAHMEAIAGMREQVVVFHKRGDKTSPAYLQMMKAIAGAQQALDDSRRILGATHD
ncbi:tyrosine-type recombinase/integrase [Ralstonia pseudosolanacearum]|uniref:tyrosine-type recombinase/integrase n=1 Tax=Ralstonia pseudosolanacearum TaxID=1310165 RepID=UPI0039C711E5